MVKNIGSAKLAHMINNRLDYTMVESYDSHMFIGISIWYVDDIVEDIHYKVFKTDEKTGADNLIVSDVLWEYPVNGYSSYIDCREKMLDVLLRYTSKGIENDRVTDLVLLSMQRIHEIIGPFE